MTYQSRICGAVLAIALFSSEAQAAPTDSDRAVAVRLVVEGRARFDALQYGTALELFKRAHEIMQVPTTGLDLAKAHEALGQLIEARTVANEVVHIPVEPNEKPIFAEARASAKEAIKALDSRIPLMQLHIVGPPVQVARVLIDGKPLTPEDVNKPYPANPGKHTIVGTAPDYHPTEFAILLVESDTTSVDIILKPMEVLPPPPPPPPPPKPSPPPDSTKSAKRNIIVGVTGGGLLLAGLGTGIAAVSTYQTMSKALLAYEPANQSFCKVECMAHRKTYEDRRPMLAPLTITTTTLGVLGVAAVLFAILDRPTRRKADVSFVVAPTPGGAVLQGVW